ncbi:MAG TPA: Calx-beta domain-containing protein [Pirellulales bacterium]|nr:Calx-beta domain-containing protein [Pirellulales bacterium]
MRLTFETLELRALVTSDVITSVPLAIASTGGTNSSAAVAAQTATANANPTTPINYSLVLTDANDNPITGPLVVGEVFFVDVFIDDTRNVSNPGVDSALTDVSFDSTLMTPSGNPVVTPNNTVYPSPTNSPHGSYNASTSPNLISSVNGSVPTNLNGGPVITPPGAGPQLLDRIQMTAEAATGVGNTTTISTVIPQIDPTDSNSVLVGADASAAPASQIGQGSVSTEILNPVSATLTGGSATAGATATTIQFTASLSGAVDVPVTIHYATVDGNAKAGTDYTGVTDGTVQLAANQQSQTFSINIAADTNSHSARSFNVKITSVDVSPTGLVTFDPTAGQGTGTINFTPPNVTIGAGSAQSGAAATTMSFPVTLSGTSDVPVVLDYSTSSDSGDTAVAGTDYTQETNQTLTIQPGDTTGTISIPISAQSSSFSGNKTFHVNVSLDSSDTSGAHLNQTSVQGSITSPAPTVSVADATAQGGTAAGTISFPIHLSGALNQSLVLDYSTAILSGDTAASTDFTAQTDQKLTIPAGTTDTAIQIPIAAQTTPFGAAKTFHLNVSLDDPNAGVQLTNTSAQGSITSPAPSLSIGDATVQGNSTAGVISFPIHLNGPSSQPVVLDYSTAILSGDTAVAGTDYTTQTNQKLTIPAGTTDTTIQIPIAAQTTTGFADKTFHVNISLDSSDTSHVSLADTSAEGTITSVPSVGILSNATDSPTQSAPSTMNFAVTLLNQQGAPTQTTQDLTIQYRVFSTGTDNAIGGSSIATSGVDYLAVDTTAANPLGQPLVIPAGQSVGTIKIPIAAELAGSINKTFHIQILSVSAGAVVSDVAGSATGTINVGQIPKPVVSIQNASLPEPTTTGQNMQFTVSLSAPSTDPVTVNYTITPGTAKAGVDYTPPATQGTVTFQPMQTTATISVPILPDANVTPSAQFLVALSEQTGNTASTISTTAGQALGTILTNGSFSGSVYVDTNNDGIHETGEHALAGATITITGNAVTGQAEQFSTTSAADGSFSFPAVPPGTYTVTQIAPTGYVMGISTPGTGVGVNGSNQMTFTITSGDVLTNNNFSERGLEPQLITKRMFLSSVIQ